MVLARQWVRAKVDVLAPEGPISTTSDSSGSLIYIPEPGES
jgi:hypothetical protein